MAEKETTTYHTQTKKKLIANTKKTGAHTPGVIARDTQILQTPIAPQFQVQGHYSFVAVAGIQF